MEDYDRLLGIANIFLRLVPDCPDMKWDKATVLERKSYHKLLEGYNEEASNCFLQAIHEKYNLLDDFKNNRDKWNQKRVYLAQTCYVYAEYCFGNGHYDESQMAISLLIDLMCPREFPPYDQKCFLLLQQGYQMLKKTLTFIIAESGIQTINTATISER